MSRKLISIVLAGVMLAPGCASWEPENRKGAVAGGLIGAGGGAIIGAMTGSWVWGALIGAGTGALAGYVIADNSHSYQRSTPKSTEATAADIRARNEADREFKLSMAARDSASAEYHLKKSIDLYPTPAAHNNMGLLELQAGKRDAARASFREAIALDPRYEPALQNLEKVGA